MSWLDRQEFLGADSAERLSGLTVTIVGLGGGGSHVAQQLAHVGVGRFILVDDDHIDDTNMNRLVGGTRQDVADRSLKVKIASRIIRAVNPDAQVICAPKKWQEVLDLLRGVDVIFGCVDNVRAKDELEAFCRRLLIPYIDQGMDVHKVGDSFLVAGQVVLSMPGAPCLRCLGVVTESALEEEARNYGEAGSKPQVVWPNGVLASTAVGLFMRTVSPWHPVRQMGECLEYDGNLHTVQPSDRMRRRRHRACSHHPQNDVGDPMFDVRRFDTIIQSPSAEPMGEPEKQAVARPWWRRLLGLGL